MEKKNKKEIKSIIKDLELTNQKLLSKNFELKESINFMLSMIDKFESCFDNIQSKRGNSKFSLSPTYSMEYSDLSLIQFKIEKLKKQVNIKAKTIKLESDSTEIKENDFNDNISLDEDVIEQLLFNADFIPKINSLEDYDLSKSKEENYLNIIGSNYSKPEYFSLSELLNKIKKLKSFILFADNEDYYGLISENILSEIENLIIIGDAKQEYFGYDEYEDAGTEYDDIHEFIISKKKLKKLIFYKTRIKSHYGNCNIFQELKNLEYFYLDVKETGNNDLEKILFNLSFNNDLKTLVIKSDSSIDLNNIILFPNLERLDLEVYPDFDPKYFNFSEKLRYIRIIFNDYIIANEQDIIDFKNKIQLRKEDNYFSYNHDYSKHKYYGEYDIEYYDYSWFEKYGGRITHGEAYEHIRLFNGGETEKNSAIKYKSLVLNLIKHLNKWKKNIQKRDGYLSVEFNKKNKSYFKYEQDSIKELSVENWPLLHENLKNEILYNVAFSKKQFDLECLYHLPFDEIKKSILGVNYKIPKNVDVQKTINDFKHVKSLVLSSDFNFYFIPNDFHSNIKSIFIYQGNNNKVELKINELKNEVKCFFKGLSKLPTQQFQVKILKKKYHLTNLNKITIYNWVNLKIEQANQINCLVFDNCISAKQYNLINDSLKDFKDCLINELHVKNSIQDSFQNLIEYHNSLISISLDSNRYIGEKVLSDLATLKSIKNLTIVKNREDLQFLEEMKSLHSITLVSNEKPLPDFSKLKSLYNLSIIDNYQDLKPLVNINNLFILDLTGNISDLVPLKDKIITIKNHGGSVKGIPNSKLFDVDLKSKINGIDENWWNSLDENWKRVFVFNIEINKIQKFQDVKFVEGINNYERIFSKDFPDIYSINVLRTLLRISQLDTLVLFEKAENIDPLINLSFIKKLVLLWNDFDLKKISSLQDLSHLEIVAETYPGALRQKELQNELEDLKDLRNLEFLKIIANNKFNLDPIRTLENLKVLSLPGNNVEFPKLDKLTKLEEFSINKNEVDDYIRTDREFWNRNTRGRVSGLYSGNYDLGNEINLSPLNSLTDNINIKIVNITGNKSPLYSIIPLKDELKKRDIEILGWDEKYLIGEEWWNELSQDWKKLLLFNMSGLKSNIYDQFLNDKPLLKTYEDVTGKPYSSIDGYEISDIIEGVKSLKTLFIENLNNSESFKSETIRVLEYFQSIENLIINDIDIEITHLSNLQQLKELYHFGKIKSIDGIDSLQNIERLWLKYYSGEKEALTNLKNLKELGVVGTGEFDFLRNLGKLDLLELFSIAGATHRGNYPLVKTFEKIDSIKNLTIHSGFGKFNWTGNPNLDLFKYISNLNTLEIFEFDPCDISYIGHTNLYKGLKELKIFFNEYKKSLFSSYKDSDLNKVFEFQSINKITINNNYFNLSGIKDLSKLKYLELRNNHVDLNGIVLPASLESLILNDYDNELPDFSPNNHIKRLNIDNYSGSIKKLNVLKEVSEISLKTISSESQLEIINKLPKLKKVNIQNNIVEINSLVDNEKIEEFSIRNNYYNLSDSTKLKNSISINKDISKDYFERANQKWWKNITEDWKDIIVFNYLLNREENNPSIDIGISFLENFRKITSKEFMYQNISDEIEIEEIIQSIKTLYIDEYLSKGINTLTPLLKFSSLEKLIIINNKSEIFTLVGLKRLTDLTLVNNRTSLHNLPSLKHLSILSLFDFKDDLGFLENLSQLKKLSLHFREYNEFNSDNLDVIKKIKNLTHLTLTKYKGELDFLKDLPSLTSLELDVHRKLDYIEKLDNLSELKLNLKEFANLDSLNHLKKLKKLFIDDDKHYNRTFDINFLSRLTGLKFLKIESHCNPIDFGTITHLNKLNHLELPKVQNLKGISKLIDLEQLNVRSISTDIEEISELIKLKSLNLSWSKTEIKGLKRLQNLEFLDLRNSNVNFIEEIYPLKKLKKIKIDQSQIKWYGEIFDNEFQNNPSLKIPELVILDLEKYVPYMEDKFTDNLKSIIISNGGWRSNIIENFEDYYDVKKSLGNAIIELSLDDQGAIYKELQDSDGIHCFNSKKNISKSNQLKSSNDFEDQLKSLVWLEHHINRIQYSEYYKEREEMDSDDFNDSYGNTYGKYSGTYAQDVAGYSDDVIDDAFDGNPDAYWNID